MNKRFLLLANLVPAFMLTTGALSLPLKNLDSAAVSRMSEVLSISGDPDSDDNDQALLKRLAAKKINFVASEALKILRQNSDVIGEAIRQGETRFDVVIMGAGIHEQIFQNIALQLGKNGAPNFKSLTIEKGFATAATFQQASDIVTANSSTRPSEPDVPNYPRVGNINEFPGGALQLSDISPIKYQTLGTFAKVSTINRSRSKAPILFGWEVVSIDDDITAKYRYLITIRDSKNRGNVEFIYAKNLVDARGIGVPDYKNLQLSLCESTARGRCEETQSLPLAEALKAPAQWGLAGEKFPLVMHSDDFYRFVSRQKDSISPFLKKRVAVVGSGDSAKTIIEYLARTSTREAYGNVVMQKGNVQEVLWYGQSALSSDEYKKDNRTRYVGLASFFKGLVKPIPSKLTRIKVNKDPSPRKLYVGGPDTLVDEEVDYVILATGYRKRLGILQTRAFGNTFRYGVDVNDEILSDPAFVSYEPSPDFVRNFPDNLTRPVCGKEVRRLETFPVKRLRGQDYYFIGPAGGSYFSRDEEKAFIKEILLGIEQNLVSIFGLGPITASTAEYLNNTVTPTSDVASFYEEGSDAGDHRRSLESMLAGDQIEINLSPRADSNTYDDADISCVFGGDEETCRSAAYASLLEMVEKSQINDVCSEVEVSFCAVGAECVTMSVQAKDRQGLLRPKSAATAARGQAKTTASQQGGAVQSTGSSASTLRDPYMKAFLQKSFQNRCVRALSVTMELAPQKGVQGMSVMERRVKATFSSEDPRSKAELSSDD